MSETLAHLKLLQKSDGISVTIRRLSSTCELIAVPAISKATLIGNGESLTEVLVDDWLIIASEWSLSNPPYPQKGDEIIVDDANKYSVSHPDDKTPVFANFNQLDRPALAWTVHSTPL